MNTALKKSLVLVLLCAFMLSAASCGAPEKETIVLFSDHRSQLLQDIVSRFNADSDDYYISIRYAGLGYDLQDHLADLAAGDIDLFAHFGANTPQALGDHRYYADLAPILAEHPTLTQALVPGIPEAMALDGGLYQLPLSYSCMSFVTDGDSTQQPVFDPITFPGYFLLLTVSGFCVDQYIDTNTMTCDFLDPAFLSLLETCKAISAENATGEEIVPALISTPSDRNKFFESGDYQYTAFPHELCDGTLIAPYLLLSVSAHCDHPDAVSAFLEIALSEEFQSQVSELPINRQALEQMVSSQVGQTTEGGRAFTQEDADKLLNMVDRASQWYCPDETLRDMIEAAAMPFFIGEQSSQQAAQAVQERVSRYLAESGA